MTITPGRERGLLILRVGTQAQVITLDPAALDLLRRLRDGATLETAWTATTLAPRRDDAELPGVLAHLLNLGVFTSIHLPTEPTS
jgi:hypothetical protein